MICFKSQECYPKAHLTSKSFRFVVFRPFSVFFRPPKSNYLFKPLPHMSRLLRKKAIPMICFEFQKCYPKAHLPSKSCRFVVFRPFSVIFRPPKSNYLFQPLPHMSRLLKKKAIPMICFESQEYYPKAHLTSKSFRFVVFRPFSVFFRPPKSNHLFQPLPHMSRLLQKKAIPMICFESQECYPKAHLTSKSFRFVVFRPFSIFFRPPKSYYTCFNLCLTCPNWSKRKPFQWYVLNLKNVTQKPTWPQKALGLWFSDLFRSFSDHLKATTCLNLCLTCLDCSERKPFQWYVLNFKNATQKPT